MISTLKQHCKNLMYLLIQIFYLNVCEVMLNIQSNIFHINYIGGQVRPFSTSVVAGTLLCTPPYPLCASLYNSIHLSIPPNISAHPSMPLYAPLHTSLCIPLCALVCVLPYPSMHLGLHCSAHPFMPLHATLHVPFYDPLHISPCTSPYKKPFHVPLHTPLSEPANIKE